LNRGVGVWQVFSSWDQRGRSFTIWGAALFVGSFHAAMSRDGASSAQPQLDVCFVEPKVRFVRCVVELIIVDASHHCAIAG